MLKRSKRSHLPRYYSRYLSQDTIVAIKGRQHRGPHSIGIIDVCPDGYKKPRSPSPVFVT